MYFSVFWCPLSYYCFFFCLFWFLLHNHHQYPRRPRGSQEKRRSESFLADWLPLGLQGCITTVPPLKGRSQRCSFWYGRVLDQSQQKRPFFACVQTSPISFVACGKGPFSACNKGNRRRLHAGNIFSAKIQSTAKFFSSSSQEENLSFLSGKSSHLYLTSRHVWISSSTCGHCCAYHLIWNWKPHQVRLWVVPHLSSGIVEWVRVKITPRDTRWGEGNFSLSPLHLAFLV